MPDPVNQPTHPRGVLADLSEGEWADILRDFESAPEAREVAADVHQVLARRVTTPPTQPHTTPKET